MGHCLDLVEESLSSSLASGFRPFLVSPAVVLCRPDPTSGWRFAVPPGDLRDDSLVPFELDLGIDLEAWLELRNVTAWLARGELQVTSNHVSCGRSSLPCRRVLGTSLLTELDA